MLKLFLVFTFLMPFSFGIQVIFKDNSVVILPYMILIICIGLKVWGISKTWLPMRNLRSLMQWNKTSEDLAIIKIAIYFFVSQSFIWDIVAHLNDFNAVNFTRIFFFYCLTPMIFFLLYRFEPDDYWKIFYSISASGAIIAVEFIVEMYYYSEQWGPSPFQVAYFNYVKALSGKEAFELVTSHHRPPGLVEHIHATAIYLAITTVISTGIYLRNRRIIYIIVASVTFYAVLFSGARLATYLCFISLLIICILYTYDKGEYRKRVIESMILIVIFNIFIQLLVSLPYAEVAQFHFKFMTGEMAPNLNLMSDNVNQISYYNGTIVTTSKRLVEIFYRNPWALLTGFGPSFLPQWNGIKTDDLFFVQMISELGLVGSILFFSSWILNIVLCFVLSISRKYTLSESLLLTLTGCVLFILLATTLHSGVIFRKGIFWMYFTFTSIVTALYYRRAI